MQSLQIPVGGWVFDALAAGPPDGRLVLLLHGFPQTGDCWRAVMPVLAGAGCRVVAPNQRGYSPAARPVGVEHYRMPLLVADIVDMAGALEVERFDVVGHDWGAAVAWQLAGRHPERLRSLTAVSVPHPFAFADALRHDPDQQQRSRYIDLFRQPDKAERLLLADDAARLRAMFGETPAVDIDRYVDHLREPAALTAALSWYRAISGDDLRGMGPVRTPTCHVWSTDDLALGRVAAEATGGYVEAPYRFEVFEEVSHWVPEQAGDRLAAVVLNHLAATGPGLA
jgi:pimeloyl-ACP methyl ester carboxylesterase